MAKLYFRYGAMNSGKSTALLQAAFNYEERDHRALLAKPLIDTKGADAVSSRLGMSRRVDILIDEGEDSRALFHAAVERAGGKIACLLVDEAQFLSADQIDGLFKIAVLDDIPVISYGIRTDFQTAAFPGSRRLLEIAHAVEELKTICRCGRKAIFNGRRVGERFVFDGDQVAIDGDRVTYESLCGQCYLRESDGRLASDVAPV